MFHDLEIDYPICHVCGKPIIELDPDDVHEDHERTCDGEGPCTCNLQAHADCCEFCQREDWQNVETWLVYRMTTDNTPLNDAVLRAVFALNVAGSRKPEALRDLWTQCAKETGGAEITAEMERIGGDPENIDWKALRKAWGTKVDKLNESNDFALVTFPATLDTTSDLLTNGDLLEILNNRKEAIGKVYMSGDTLRIQVDIHL